MNRLNKIIVICVVLGVIGFGVLLRKVYFSHHKVDASKVHGAYLESPRGISSFSLNGVDDKPFTEKSLKGHWTMLFFGFTNCGHLCPTTMAELGKMTRLLQAQGVSNLPQVVMITIDPERDSLEKLRKYVTAFHPGFYGARGDIVHMTKELGIAYEKISTANTPDPNKNYDVLHSGAVMLFNPEGQLNAFFTTPHHSELLAKDYVLITNS